MADTFRQIELLEAMSFVCARLGTHGLKMVTMPTSGRRVRYMVVSIEHNFVIKRDLTFRQVAAYADTLSKDMNGPSSMERAYMRDLEQS